MRYPRPLFPAALLPFVLGLAACEADLGPRVGQRAESFGAIVFREACQRVAYTADLEARLREPDHPVDASGASYRALCAGEVPAPASSAPALRALTERREELVRGVNGVAPEALLDSLDAYLRALTPLQEDGTVGELLGRGGRLLERLSEDGALTMALARLGRQSGVHPPETAGGLPRSLAAAPALDDVMAALLPLLLPGGEARGELEALLRALVFTLRHLEPSMAPGDPERSEALLRDLLFQGHPELATGRTVLLAWRDYRGLPLLAEIVPPYVADPQTGLARADAQGRFLDASGGPIPHVPPLPELGQAADKVLRDAQGRALRNDGKPLYRYVELDSSLLLALLRDGHRLFADRREDGTEVNIPLALLRAVALLSGSRDSEARKTRGGQTLTYRAFVGRDAPLLDLAHGAAQLLRFRSAGAPGEDLLALLGALRTLLGTPAHEGPLARSLKALLDAADEAKKPAYDGARIPADSTLYDDLAPLVVRLLAAEPRDERGRKVTLLEDLIDALQDPHSRALGPMLAQLLDERGLFFMRQLGQRDGLTNLPRPCVPDPDEANNGLTPCGVVGDLGHPPDRAAPDSDVEIDWRGQRTSDPRNNRSVVQRLLHLIADTNGTRPFCNGRNASVFGGFVVFQRECDMFQVDNMARFFLLSMASPALRRDEATFAKQAASFREAIRNGRNCRCTPGAPDPRERCEDPDARRKCDALLSNIDDGLNGDNVLAGLMGLPGFGRYPEPPVGARALFADLSSDVSSIRRTRALLYNFVQHVDGTLVVDPRDPDNRKFTDGTGSDRLLVEEHNGVLFALEKVRGPTVYPDGTPNPFPNDTFYDAMRPLVDAFARHAECFQRDMAGRCVSGQNATQILADAMTVLHRHWPSARSQIFGRSFAASYGPQVHPDGAVSYEPLAARMLAGDLWLATAELAPVLSALTVEGRLGGRRALPLLNQFLRFVFDPSQAPSGGFAFRDGRRRALRYDNRPAYDDDALARVLGTRPAGQVTPFYLLAEAVRRARDVLDLPRNRDHKQRARAALSDAMDALLPVHVVEGMGGRSYRFDNPRLRPVSMLLLDFLRGRVEAHAHELPAWSDQLVSDLGEVIAGPLYAGLLDLGVRLDAQDGARRASYALLRQLLDDQGASLGSLAVALADGMQLLLDDADLVPLGRALAGALDLASGPLDPGLVLAQRGRELERASPAVTERPMLVKLLRNAYAQEPDGVYPAHRLGEVVAEVNRAHPGQGGAYSADDYRALLGGIGRFLVDQRRGLTRFMTIVQQRLLP